MKTDLFSTKTARLTAGRWVMAAVLLCAAAAHPAEPTFTNVTATVAPDLPQVGFSSVAWGDYDNDGRLDFLITGWSATNSISQLWRNTGNGFVNVTTLAPGLPRGGSAAWAAFDNDGRFDLLITGITDEGYVSQLWRNTENGFTNVTATLAPGLPRVLARSVAWADFDNDGRLDFLIAGGGLDEFLSQLWRNTGSGFTNVTASVAPGLPRVNYTSSVAWGDYDNDGRLDFLLTGGVDDGDSGSYPVSQLWRNTGNGFTNVTAAVAPGLAGAGSVAWGDYDNDGRLDFLMGSQLWRNTGNQFTNVTTTVAPGLSGGGSGSVAWGDYDNDGLLDFLITGYFYNGSDNYVSHLWRNTGNGFTNATASVAPGLPSVVYSSVAWGDYDDDGRLDFLITGRTNFNDSRVVSQLWHNNAAQTNPPPAVITERPANVSPTSVALNARINPRAHAANAWFIWGGTTNYTQVTAAQPVGNSSSFTNFSQTITGLSPGVTYYYRAVGSNEQGRVVLGLEQRFLLASPGVTTSPADLSPTSPTLNGHVNPNNVPTYGWFEWGLTPAFGQVTPAQFLGSGLDATLSRNLTGLEVGSTYYFRAVASNSLVVTYGALQSFVTPTFVNVTTTVAPDLTAVARGVVTWADYDGDGRLDFHLTGYYFATGQSVVYVSQLWRNTGSGFTDVTAAVAPGLPAAVYGSVAWGDYDNDGRLDLLLTGDSNSGGYPISQIWRNTENGFVNVTATVAPGLPPASYSSVAWGDYDNDGRLDFLLSGGGHSQLWRNTGSGFANVTATVAPDLPQVANASVAWGDYDNDGRLDFLLTGSIGSSYYSQIWRNTGNGFTNVTAAVAPGLPGVRFGSVAWGDYDNDGLLDFLLTGSGGNAGAFSQVWRNTGSGFTNVTATVAPDLPRVQWSSVAWGDYDNDGRLDFLLTGSDKSQVWRNTESGFVNVTDTVAPGLPRVQLIQLAWGDYDGDGRLDFFHIPQVWRNYTPITNTPPNAPTGLAMTASSNAVMLSWNSATDAQTPASGLTYNVRAGTTPGGNDLLSAHVNATNGFRRVPAVGNAMLRHSLPLTGLTNGQTVYWSVQAVDTAFAGGPFATEISVVSLPQLTLSLNAQPSTLNLSWTPPTFGWLLQESTDLGPSNWSSAASGSANPATLPATNGAQFYRLCTP